MKRISFFISACLVFSLFSCSEKRGETAASSPNIIILLADDLGYGDLGCFGHPYIKTPNLDKLAKEGMRFTNFYAAAPVCSPSRAGLLTGRIPNRLGIYDWIPENSAMHIPASTLTIAALLKRKGYQTAMFGKWHCNGMFNTAAQPQPGALGFDFWMATQNNAIPGHKDPVNFIENGKAIGKQTGYSAGIVAAKMTAWLEQRDPQKPFFCYVPFHEPHEPVESPASFVDHHREAVNGDQAHYFASVENMDKAIGDILNKLQALGLEKNTLVLFTSDNGPETLLRYPAASRSYGSPGALKGMKVQLYEGGIKVPGIVRWPEVINPGQVSSAVVSGLDLLPTLSGITGAQLPGDNETDGENISDVFSDPGFQRKTDLFWFYPTAVSGPNVALVSGNYKLMAYTRHRYLQEGDTKGILVGNKMMQALKEDSLERFEIVDLSVYPAESQSLARTKTAVFDSLKQKMEHRFYELRKASPVIDFGFE